MTIVTGASGQLGTAFRRLLPSATFLDRAGLDLSDVGSLRARLAELRPERLINCAAYTAVDRAEEELGGWIESGDLTPVEHVFDGFDSMPRALASLYDGVNKGVTLCRVRRGPYDDH